MQTVGTCTDCWMWDGPRGSAHDPARCPFRQFEIDRARARIAELQRWLRAVGVEP